jgi:hypothetical protein
MAVMVIYYILIKGENKMIILKKYGFEVGKVYKSKMAVEDENGTYFPEGTLIKIVAIVPKVRIVTGFRNTDSKEYFYNGVVYFLGDSLKSPRIRCNFCTLYKKEIK